MFSINLVKDYFVSEQANNLFITNEKTKKQITVYLPKYSPEKVFDFFIASSHKILVVINNDEDQYWNCDKKTIVLPKIPGTEVRVRAILGKWQVTTNSPLTFR